MLVMDYKRYIVPVVAGVMGSMVVQAFGEQGIHMMYPPPSGITFTDKVAIAAYIGSLPAMAFVLLLADYIICAFLAGAVATFVSGRESSRPAIMAGVFTTLASLLNVVRMPGQPLWFSFLSVLVYLPVAYVAFWVFRKRVSAQV